MQKFTLINKDKSRIKVFEPFEDVSKPSTSIDAMMISYGCVYKRSSKPVVKGSRVETIEAARKEYKQLLDEGWKKTNIFRSYFQLYVGTLWGDTWKRIAANELDGATLVNGKNPSDLLNDNPKVKDDLDIMLSCCRAELQRVDIGECMPAPF